MWEIFSLYQKSYQMPYIMLLQKYGAQRQVPTTVFTRSLCRPHWDHLYGSSNRHAEEPERNAQEPLWQSERVCVCESTQKFDDDNLEEDRANEYRHKYIVVQNAFEDVYLFHLSGADLIENLHNESAFCCKSMVFGEFSFRKNK